MKRILAGAAGMIILLCATLAAAADFNSSTLTMLAIKMRELETKVSSTARPAISTCAAKLEEARTCYDAACAAPAIAACDNPAVRRIPAARPIINKVVEAKGCFSLTGSESKSCWETLKADIETDTAAIDAFRETANGPEDGDAIPEGFLKRDVTMKIHREHPHIGTKDVTLIVKAPKPPRTYAPSAAILMAQADAASDSNVGETIALWTALPLGGLLIGYGAGELFGPEETGTDNGDAFFNESAGPKAAAIGLGVGLGIAALIQFTGNDKPTATASNGRTSGLATVLTW